MNITKGFKGHLKMPNHTIDGAYVELINAQQDDEGIIVTVILLETRGIAYPIGSEVDVAPYEFKRDT
jgi:hypothetical protein